MEMSIRIWKQYWASCNVILCSRIILNWLRFYSNHVNNDRLKNEHTRSQTSLRQESHYFKRSIEKSLLRHSYRKGQWLEFIISTNGQCVSLAKIIPIYCNNRILCYSLETGQADRYSRHPARTQSQFQIDFNNTGAVQCFQT